MTADRLILAASTEATVIYLPTVPRDGLMIPHQYPPDVDAAPSTVVE